ncbi:MAG TPA: DUF885 domain-containing protein [Gemmatimonadaceae bacterium]
MHRRDFLAATTQSAIAFGIFRRLAPMPGANPAGGAPSPFAALRDRYFVRTLQLNPVTSTYLGGDGYGAALADANGMLRDFSPKGIADELAFYRGVQGELAGIDRSTLTPAERIDHDVLGAQLRFLVHQGGELRYHERCVDTYVAEPFRGVDWQIQQMTDAGNGLLGTEGEWALVVARLEKVPAYVETAKQNLQAGIRAGNRPDHRMVKRDGIDGSRANVEYFRATLPKLAREHLGERPFAAAMLGRIQAAGARAADAYASFGDFLGTAYDPGDTTDRFAAGEKEYDWRLRNNLRETRTAAELWEYGAEQVALYEGKIFEVARRAAGDAKLALAWDTPDARRASVRKVMDHLSKDSPKSDDELFAWYRDAGKRAVQYGRDHDLFDIPADYRLDVVPTPPVLRSTIDAAYYPAPPFKKSGVGRFYLTPTGNDPAALALNNRASVADTAIHEGFPGHDWHYKYMTQHAAEISNIRWLTPGAVEDSSSMWEDSMAAEGWGLYSEELMSEPAAGKPYGFYTPGEYLYELQGQLLRAVRVRVDVGLHTGRMTFDQALDYFTEHVSFYPRACELAGKDPQARAVCEGAERAIYRYSKWPTQAITYNLGKNAIVSLREAYRKQKGAAYSAKAFHERLMRQGTIPAGYFRDEFLAGKAV